MSTTDYTKQLQWRLRQQGVQCPVPHRKIVQITPPSPPCYIPQQPKPYVRCLCKVVPVLRKPPLQICNQCVLRQSRFPQPIPSPSPPQIVIVGDQLFNSTIPGTIWRTMMVSSDGGVSWNQTLGDDIGVNIGGIGTRTQCVAYGNGRWVAAGQFNTQPFNPANWSSIVSSSTGTSWSFASGPFPDSAVRVAYGNGRWFVCGLGISVSTLFTSTDGISFTDATLSTGLPGFGVSYAGIWYGNGQWIIGKSGADLSGNCMFRSTDGVSWVQCLGDTFDNGICWDIKYNGTRWVAVGQQASGSPGTYTISTSSDGITWTRNTTATFTSLGPFTNSLGFRVSYGNGRWFAVGTGTEILTSTDANTWTNASVSGISIPNYTDIAWTGSQWILTGASGNPFVFVSPNGISWTGVAISGLSSGNPRGFAIAVN